MKMGMHGPLVGDFGGCMDDFFADVRDAWGVVQMHRYMHECCTGGHWMHAGDIRS